jgi:hypothetical protein
LGLVKGRCHIITARRGTIHLGDAPRLLLRDGSVHPHCSDALGRHQLVTAVVFGAWGLKTLPFCLLCKIYGFLSPITTATPEMTYSLKAPSGRLTLALKTVYLLGATLSFSFLKISAVNDTLGHLPILPRVPGI